MCFLHLLDLKLVNERFYSASFPTGDQDNIGRFYAGAYIRSTKLTLWRVLEMLDLPEKFLSLVRIAFGTTADRYQ
jgi:hypothetical protein